MAIRHVSFARHRHHCPAWCIRPRGRRTGTNKRACGYRGARFLTPAASLIFGTYWPVMRDATLRALCGRCLGSAKGRKVGRLAPAGGRVGVHSN